MKIAIWYNLPYGGAKRALYEQVKRLISRGHTVETWCPPDVAAGHLPLTDLVTQHVEPLEEVGKVGKLGGPYERNRRRLLAMENHCKRSARQIELKQFDLLLAHPCMFFATSPIALHISIPSLLYLQDPKRDLYEASPQSPWPAPDWMGRTSLRPRYLKNLLREARHHYAFRIQAREELRWDRGYRRILVNSLFSRECILRAYGLDSHMCRLGIDAECFQPSGDQRGKYVIGLGSIAWPKGIDRLVKALATVSRDVRPELIWVGAWSDNAIERDIRALAEAKGVQMTTKVMVDDAELVRLLSCARCMVYAPRLEPFGFAPLEANACGTPVVGVAEGGVRETVVDGVNGFLVTSPEPAAFGEAVERFCRDVNLANEMGRKARDHVVKRWSWERGVDDLESHLAAVLRDSACSTGTM